MGREDGNNDGRYVAERNDREHPERAFVTEEPLSVGPDVSATLVGVADRAVDQRQVGHRRVLLENLGVHEGGQHDGDAFRSAGAQDHFHGDGP